MHMIGRAVIVTDAGDGFLKNNHLIVCVKFAIDALPGMGVPI